ncbi:MAG TPA: pyridoxal 5'-phosphate synthase glutaminase subunit PdxT [Acidimicrobiales bacterium]|nr:pyridoxal 5'-phosphate synthase glutaminase subunit PdxT [Acidimicrobiales bacterium]
MGIVALQGDVAEHAAALTDCGAQPVEVRVPADLAGVDAVVLPGGESTTMSLLFGSSGLYDPLAELLADGLPAFGTCAGMIMLATEVLDGRPDQRCLGAIDIAVRRNAFGRQVDSFEAEVAVGGLEGSPFPAVFIRAPVVERTGAGVEVLAHAPDGRAVLCRQGAVLAAAFHPELSADRRLHELFLGGLS